MPRLSEIELELVGLCNATCGYCDWQRKEKSAKSIMPSEIALRVLEEADELGVNILRFHGVGESTLHPKIVDILAAGRKYPRIAQSLSTNCSNLFAPLRAPLLAHDLARMDHLELTLAVPWIDSREEFVTRCAHSAREYLKLKPQNREIILQLVTHADAEKWMPVLESFLPMVEDLPNARIFLKTPVTWPGAVPQLGFRPSIAPHEKIVVDALVAPVSIGGGCSMPEYALMVSSHGRVSPCCVSVVEWDIGSFPEKSLSELWESTRLSNIRAGWKSGDHSIPCGSCRFREFSP